MRRVDYPLVELAQGPIRGRCARAYTDAVQLHIAFLGVEVLAKRLEILNGKEGALG
jgi:hypothetical protein